MKILVISNRYPPNCCGGYELECLSIVEELRKRGQDVFVVTANSGIKLSEPVEGVFRTLRFTPDEIPSQVDAEKNRSPYGFLNAQRKLGEIGRYNAHQIRNLIESIRPDLVYIWHLYGLTYTALVPVVESGVPFAYRLADRWLINLMRYYFGQRSIRSLLRRGLTGFRSPSACLSASAFIMNSHALLQDHVAAGMPDDRAVVIYPGVEVPDAVPPLPDVTGQFKLIYAGRLCEDKGVHVAIRALKELVSDSGNAEVRLDIVGSGPESYIAKLKAECMNLGVESHVRFLGMFTRQEVQAAFTQAHALVFTSIWAEPFGMVPVEAMACGLPVVASSVGGASEYLDDGTNALIYPAGDHSALASAVRKLMQSTELRLKLRDNGRLTAVERFEIGSIAEQHEKCLLSIVDDKRHRQGFSGG